MLSIQRIMSKWAKTNALLKSEALREFIPTTRLFSRDTLEAMFSEHRMLYVKPVNGTFGNGVMKVQRLSQGSYTFQLGTKAYSCTSFDQLYMGLARKIGHRSYLVQQGIPLLKHNGRRFDIRVMVQVNSYGEWETTGIIGRLGQKSKIVTNYHSGGTPMAFSRLMSSHLSADAQASYTRRLSKLGVLVSKQLQLTYPGIKEIGVDIAIDQSLRPWILEVNTNPDPFIFRKLKDPSVFRKIYRYAIGYGKYKSKSKKARVRKLVKGRTLRGLRTRRGLG